jgi:hypothetical protein
VNDGFLLVIEQSSPFYATRGTLFEGFGSPDNILGSLVMGLKTTQIDYTKVVIGANSSG